MKEMVAKSIKKKKREVLRNQEMGEKVCFVRVRVSVMGCVTHFFTYF